MRMEDADVYRSLETFAYLGELSHLVKLARRFVDDENDVSALCNGAHVMADGLEAVGYRDSDEIYLMALGTFLELSCVVPAWRLLCELPDYKIDRIVALARRSRGGTAGEEQR